MDAQDKTTVSSGGLIVEHIDAVTGRRLVVIRGDLRILGDLEQHGHEHGEELIARVAELEARLNSLTSQ